METVTETTDWLVVLVVVVGLGLGAMMVATVLGKYWIHQWFHAVGGPFLVVFGAALVGLSIYGNVKIKAAGFEAELSHLQASLQKSEEERAVTQVAFSQNQTELVTTQVALSEKVRELSAANASLERVVGTLAGLEEEFSELRYVAATSPDVLSRDDLMQGFHSLDTELNSLRGELSPDRSSDGFTLPTTPAFTLPPAP